MQNLVWHTRTAMQSSAMIVVVYACLALGDPLRPTPLLSSKHALTEALSGLACMHNTLSNFAIVSQVLVSL